MALARRLPGSLPASRMLRPPRGRRAMMQRALLCLHPKTPALWTLGAGSNPTPQLLSVRKSLDPWVGFLQLRNKASGAGGVSVSVLGLDVETQVAPGSCSLGLSDSLPGLPPPGAGSVPRAKALCPHFPFSQGHLSWWVKAHPSDLCEDLSPVSHVRREGVGPSPMDSGGSQHSPSLAWLSFPEHT